MKTLLLTTLLLGACLAGTVWAQDQPLRLELLQVHDPGINNEVAFTMLIPAGWQTRGGIEWRHNQSNLAVVNLTVTSPDGKLVFQAFPVVPCVWKRGGMPFLKPGDNDLGNVVYPPITDVAQYVNEAILPYYRPGIDMKLVDRQPLPKVAQTVSQAVAEPNMQKQVLAERVRLAYQLQGENVEEDYYVSLVFTTSQLLPGTTFWQAHQQYAFRAPAGELDQYAPLLNTMIASVRVQPRWQAGYLYVMQLKHQNQMQAIRNAGELSRRIARNSEEIMRMNQEAFENRQRSSDRIAREISETIRGVETYHDPYQDRQVELPDTYKDVWVSETGQYILSNDVTYNPNEQPGTAVNWQRAKVVK